MTIRKVSGKVFDCDHPECRDRQFVEKDDDEPPMGFQVKIECHTGSGGGFFEVFACSYVHLAGAIQRVYADE